MEAPQEHTTASQHPPSPQSKIPRRRHTCFARREEYVYNVSVGAWVVRELESEAEEALRSSSLKERGTTQPERGRERRDASGSHCLAVLLLIRIHIHIVRFVTGIGAANEFGIVRPAAEHVRSKRPSLNATLDFLAQDRKLVRVPRPLEDTQRVIRLEHHPLWDFAACTRRTACDNGRRGRDGRATTDDEDHGSLSCRGRSWGVWCRLRYGRHGDKCKRKCRWDCDWRYEHWYRRVAGAYTSRPAGTTRRRRLRYRPLRVSNIHRLSSSPPPPLPSASHPLPDDLQHEPTPSIPIVHPVPFDLAIALLLPLYSSPALPDAFMSTTLMQTTKLRLQSPTGARPAIAKHILAADFINEYEETRKVADIAKAISAFRSAVDLTPEAHPILPSYLEDLETYSRRASSTVEILVILLRLSAVRLAPEGGANMTTRLHNLGISLQARFQRGVELVDVSAISACQFVLVSKTLEIRAI
ncbi:hypothetical protein DFP72DRAFT_1169132 [Ephemerocybe angulata]|uniref:Uncharacterized protein n=1 Tax=Ephemerocybe angulata TaxID=980116 RepID=A0A8H6I1E3_9AGAR|nr:hypothetical protein DFP72DRAFT_1169132 [Tulosesus angulatus]